MKKRTISKLKSIFGHKSKSKGKRQLSRTPSPVTPEAAGSPHTFRPIRTPTPPRVGPPPSPPVPTNPRVPVAPEPSGPLLTEPCPVCGRTFVPASLDKHVKICEKMVVKKRKTFDSSRQRREGLAAAHGVINSGTDLAQFLPKNFGLPENSPFLEKSPPNTAKTIAVKPHKPSVRQAIQKPTSDLQRCPHCNRAFGPRAFERHVEWCGDKAKILPAAPAHPPPHVADAKQRLNARTQYKAPLARGRRSSQTRERSLNSRSASVESTRDVSPPPPPRDSGDFRRGRSRASESSDVQDEPAHVPVIRNARNSQPQDAHVRARQARLARDLSSSRPSQPSASTTVQQSSTDPNIKIPENKETKSRNKFTVPKQIKQLEELAQKYSEKCQKYKKRILKENKDIDPLILMKESSKLPVKKKDPKIKIQRKLEPEAHSEIKLKVNDDLPKAVTFIDEKPEPLLITNKTKIKPPRPSAIAKRAKEKRDIIVPKKDVKERTMSLDSLEINDSVPKTCQSIGINTELLCVPCVIHENAFDKITNKNLKLDEICMDTSSSSSFPKVELLYKNLTMVSSCDIQARNSFTMDTTPSDIQNVSSEMESPACNVNKQESYRSEMHSEVKESNSAPESNYNLKNDNCFSGNAHKDIQHSPSEEKFQENDEHDLNDENFDEYAEDKVCDTEGNLDDVLQSRHGSSETYTKFTDNDADLEEFINATDKLMNVHDTQNLNDFNSSDLCQELHTPTATSIENINKDSDVDLAEKTKVSLKHSFSDTLSELKDNLKDLLKGAGVSMEEAKQTVYEKEKDELSTKRKRNDLEHIILFEKGTFEDKPVEENDDRLRLPSINENNKVESKIACTNKRMQKIYKSTRKYKMLGEQKKGKTYIFRADPKDSDTPSTCSEAPPFKLPRVDNKKPRIDDTYDPFLSAARQMKELMSSETNLPAKLNSSSNHTRTLPSLRNAKDKASHLRPDNTKMMKDTINKTYQKTPTLQRMKSFGSTNNDNTKTFGGRCSSFRLNRSDTKKSSQKLNSTFTKSSKENISTVEKSPFNRNNSLNRSFSSYTASAYSTPKPKDKIPKISTSLYHSFQRTTIKQPAKLDKIKKDEPKKDFVSLDLILADDNSSLTDSTNYIDPRLINENDNLPINVNTILNNPDMISSMESLLTTENLPAKFESFSSNAINNNAENKVSKESQNTKEKSDANNLTNNNTNKPLSTINDPIIDDLSAQYDKLMSSLEQSIASKTSIRDDDSLCEDFDLEEFMTSFDDEIKQKTENKRTYSSTTRVVKQSQLVESKSELNSNCSTPKIVKSGSNGAIPFNKSVSLTFSGNNLTGDTLFPSSIKRATSLLDSIQKKNKSDAGMSRHKADQLEQDIMQSLKEFDQFYENETRNEEITSYNVHHNGTARRGSRVKTEKKSKKLSDDDSNGNYASNVKSNGHCTPNGKSSDSAYSSLNRISPSKLSICTSKETTCLDQIPAGSDSSHLDNGVLSVSSDEFLAMERSAELDAPVQPPEKHLDNHKSEKRTSSRASSRHSGSWRAPHLSSSGSESSLHGSRHGSRTPLTLPRPSRFCHECGHKFPVEAAKFCMECGVKRLLV